MLRTLARFRFIAAGMEYFPAVDEEQFNYIRTIIDYSDYYAVIVAGKYGSLAPDGIGYSEKEYDYAIHKSIPVIAFIRQDIEAIEQTKRETDPRKIEMLDAFRRRLSTGRLVAYWKDETDLCLHLIDSLNTTVAKYPRNGWIRGARENPEDLLRRIVELEDANQRLRDGLAASTEAPIIDHLKYLLGKKNIQLDYIYSDLESGTVQNDSYSASLLDIGRFALPRMGYNASRRSWTQVRDSVLEDALREFIRGQTEREATGVDQSTLDETAKALSDFGLITTTTNGFQNLHVVAVHGGQLVSDQLAAANDLAKIRSDSDSVPTLSKILSDLAIWIKRRPLR